MAKATKAAKVNKADPSLQIPEGFTPVSSIRSGAWFKPDMGKPVYGELLGRYKRKKANKDGKYGYFYQIMIEKPCPAVKKETDEDGDRVTVEVDLTPGEIISVDERSALEELAALVDNDKRWRVFIQPLDKVPVPGTNQTVWNFNVGKQEIIAGKNEPKVKPKGEGVPNAEEEIPF